ncbi:alpha/beta hydrolase [Candidatus Margulisiibacteriota bacterium]
MVKFRRPLYQKIILLLGFILAFLFTTTLLTAVHLVRLLWIRLIFHPLLLQRKISRKDPGSYQLPYENIILNTQDGLNLTGWFIPAAKKSGKTVILCHGITNSKAFFLPEAAYIVQAGYNLLIFDLRAHGRSEGNFVTFGLKEQIDLEAAIDYLKKERPAAARKIGILAHSMGAATTIFVAVRRKELKALVLINCYNNIETDMAYWVTTLGKLPHWPFVQLGIKSFKKELKVDLKEVSPLQSVSKIKAPMFFICSAEDEVTDPKDTHRLYEKAKGQKYYWCIPNAKHETYHQVAGMEFEKKILDFYKKAL